MKYADILLPVPLEGFFTYAVPEKLRERIAFGMRVLVNFGPQKTYVGIVVKTHDEEPKGYKTKDIIDIEDEHPMLLDKQFKLWKWIADYYLAPIGDIYKAAMPAGLKAEDGYKPKTETYIRLAEKFRNVLLKHIGEAVGYRKLDRGDWAERTLF